MGGGFSVCVGYLSLPLLPSLFRIPKIDFRKNKKNPKRNTLTHLPTFNINGCSLGNVYIIPYYKLIIKQKYNIYTMATAVSPCKNAPDY